jgi:hypothetical protein
MIEIVVVCIAVAEVAVTVMLDVTGCGASEKEGAGCCSDSTPL